MQSNFEDLRRQLLGTSSPHEREILLQGMARVGNFEDLRRQLLGTSSPHEREILLKGMVRVGNFEDLRRQLLGTSSPHEREILLQGMVRVGNFEDLRRQLLGTSSPHEREILLKGMVNPPQQLIERTDQVVTQNQGVRRNLGRVSKPSGKQFDVFIAHASEDKTFVTPLALSLRRRGLKVWYDDFVLKVGDSLRREIDKGLALSQYGIVILSHNFFRKHWPQKELDGLAAKEELGKKVILPVWHNIDKAEVASYSPTLADIVAVKSSMGIEAVLNKIIEAIAR